MRRDSLPRLWRYINLLLTYLLTSPRGLGFRLWGKLSRTRDNFIQDIYRYVCIRRVRTSGLQMEESRVRNMRCKNGRWQRFI